MNEMIIREAFEELKYGYVKDELAALYDGIYQEICDASAETLANMITSKESKRINSFYLKLDKEVRRVIMKKMKDMGVPDESAPLIWTRIRRNIQSPEVRLCNQEGYYENGRSSERANAVTSAPKKVERKTAVSPPKGKWVVIAGVAVEIIAWIFIPAYKTWSPIVKGVGILLVAAGAAVIYKERQSEPRITLTDAAVHQAKERSKEYVKDICKKQCELNHRVFCDWLDQICDAAIKECKAEID